MESYTCEVVGKCGKPIAPLYAPAPSVAKENGRVASEDLPAREHQLTRILTRRNTMKLNRKSVISLLIAMALLGITVS